ncbi:hypothetical protein KIV45_10650 [Janthinobacterium lividum]|nr:hypothetical protein KIV45_10650 [Janthinobacterium lividum]
MKHTDTIALEGSITDMRQRIAAEQAAMHKVRLGVARWRNAPATQDADASPLPASQTHWHAETQCHFMCWLELGGFAHADAASENVATPVTTNLQYGTSTTTAPARQASATLPAHCNGCAA